MLELLLLNHVLKAFYYNSDHTVTVGDKVYDYDKVYKRYLILMDKFLSPYVINNDSKE